MTTAAAKLVSARSAGATRAPAGSLPDGTAIESVTLTAANGVSARILTYGATLQSLIAPDRDGQPADVVLGYDDAAGYVGCPNYFGVTVGRVANRIGGSGFTLDGVRYEVPRNDGDHSLHGGDRGFDKQVWRIEAVEDGPPARVVLAHRSPDGDSGYPGELDVTVCYALDDEGALTIAFEARTTKPTMVNLTNHAVFNLSGEGAAAGTSGHRLTIPAAAYTPVDPTRIPTGECRPVAGTAFDFRSPRVVADAIRDGRDAQIRYGRGYDHNFALDKGHTAAPEPAARVEDPSSGRVLDVLTTEPGIQLYTGNYLDGTRPGKKGHLYRMGDGIALEPQKFPDSPNRPDFVSARIDPDTPYRHVMVYRLSTTR
ncbi:aldose epimerase family protein [Sphingomonas sp. ac-8]|uniref:aldose epimerase family protein n=1 Tax=Sphingomonas sp. ac-8 TaxID=3242977 RepID=UPI003A80DB0E